MGEQYVGIDLHRRRSVIVRMTGEGQVLETVRIDNDPVALSLELAKAGPDPRWSWRRPTAGTGPPTCCRRAGPGSTWPTRWGSRCSASSGSRPTPATRPIWPSCCAWVGCLRPGWRRRRSGNSASWSATGPSWWHCVAASRPRSTPCWQGGHAGADERPVRGGRYPAAGPAAAGTGLWAASRFPTLADWCLRPGDHHPTARGRHRVGRRCRLPGHPRSGPGAGSRVRGRDRRRRPLRRRPSVVLLGRTHPASPRVRHYRAPRPDHQTGPKAGPLRRRRGHPAPPRGSKQAGDFHRIADRRGTGIGRVAAARKLLTLVYYGLRDGQVRCLAPTPRQAI
jgi:hypothetical protein